MTGSAYNNKEDSEKIAGAIDKTVQAINDITENRRIK